MEEKEDEAHNLSALLLKPEYNPLINYPKLKTKLRNQRNYQEKKSRIMGLN